MTLPGTCSKCQSVTCNPYLYRWSGGCNQPPYCVYSAGVVHPTTVCFIVVLSNSTSCTNCQLVASWCSSNDIAYWVLDLGLLLSNSQFLPSCLIYITTPGIFLYPLMTFQFSGRIISSSVLLSSRFQCWTSIDSWYFGLQFLVLCILFDQLLFVQYIFAFPVSCLLLLFQLYYSYWFSYSPQGIALRLHYT